MSKVAIMIIVLIILIVLIIGVVLVVSMSDPWTGDWVDDVHGKIPITKITRVDNKVRLQFQAEDYTVPIETDGSIKAWGLKGTNKGSTIVWTDAAGKVINTFYKK